MRYATKSDGNDGARYDPADMLIGYNTNGFAHHRIADAIAILSDIGYESVAVTLEPDLLDPPDRRGVRACVDTLRSLLGASGLRATIETGSRFILDPRRKHQPTLLSRAEGDRRRRIDFLEAAIDVATGVGADCVSLWSGSPDDDASSEVLLQRLTDGLRALVAFAEPRNMPLAFEPEPGMFVARMADFDRLCEIVDDPLFGLTLDVGHVHCLADGDIGEHLRRQRVRLFNVHIEDMRRGVHEHLMFGEGDMDFGAVFLALREIEYAGPVHVELSRHAHDAVRAATEAYRFLRPLVDGASAG